MKSLAATLIHNPTKDPSFILKGSASIHGFNSIFKSKLTLLASSCRIIYTVCGSPSRDFWFRNGIICTRRQATP